MAAKSPLPVVTEPRLSRPTMVLLTAVFQLEGGLNRKRRRLDAVDAIRRIGEHGRKAAGVLDAVIVGSAAH